MNSKGILGGNRGRTVLETLLVVILVSVLGGVAAERYLSEVRSIRESALTVELSNLRRAVNYFALFNGKLPENLDNLLKARIILPKSNLKGAEYEVVVVGPFVESMDTGADGRPLDPFSNPYAYDPSTGRVASTTPGYGSW